MYIFVSYIYICVDSFIITYLILVAGFKNFVLCLIICNHKRA